MLCADGMELFRAFQGAVDARNAKSQSQPQTTGGAERPYHHGTEQTPYNLQYLAWVAHRAFCVECRSVAATREITNLVSM